MQPCTAIYSHIQPYTITRSYIQPYTTMHNHIRPYAAICNLIQPCSYIHQDASIYSHMSPYTTISVNGAKLCQSARGVPSSPLARFNTIWHHSLKEFRHLLTRFRTLDLHQKVQNCRSIALPGAYQIQNAIGLRRNSLLLLKCPNKLD